VGILRRSIARLIQLPCRLNVKLGGINAIPEARDISFLTDSANPTIVMGRRLMARFQVIRFTPVSLGADVMHPAPGSDDRPSYTSLVGSIDTSGVRYVSTMEVQTSRKEIIEAMESMSTVRLQAFLDEHMTD